jgi:hypothetical protein
VGGFVPSPELLAWARSTFIEDGASLQNPEHEHLQQAKLGFLWTNEPNGRRGRVILGTCQLLPPTGDKWSIGARVLQLSEWFVGMPDFLITIFAPAAVEMDNASFMALVEHELYHASQKRSAEGEPMFSRETGEPIWATRAHDVEQFVGVVRRYGAQAAMVEDMVAAANAGPEIAPARIAFGCGNCL